MISNSTWIYFGAPVISYLIYIYNIHRIELKGDISFYADNTALFCFGHAVDLHFDIVDKLFNIFTSSHSYDNNHNYIVI